MDSILYTLAEEIRGKNYVVATYYMKLKKDENALKKAEMLAIGQTIGTWMPVPGITDEIKRTYMGKVVNVFDIPSIDLETQLCVEEKEYLIQIAYPAVHFGKEFPLLLTSLLGNDASTSAQVKLLDIEMPQEYVSAFDGPKFGIQGIRDIVGVKERPILMNMIKPCTGLTPDQGAKVFYEAALGGVDIIKDDELLGNPSYSKPEDRVRAYKKAAVAASEHTGEMVKYFVNVTCGAKDIVNNVRRVIDAGADGIMLNFAAVGYSVLHEVAEVSTVPILGHSAGSGMYYEGVGSGMSSPLAVGKLARLAGADTVMINTPYGGYPMVHQKYMQTLAGLTLPFYNIKPTMPSIGGGVHPGMVETYMEEAGNDVILASGGAIQGHPSGTTAGAKAMRETIGGIMEGESLETIASQREEVKLAIELWGNHKK